MTLALGIALLALAATWWVILRDSLSPAFVFPLVWGVALVALSILPIWGYEAVRPQGLIVFAIGNLVFSGGAGAVQLVLLRKRHQREVGASNGTHARAFALLSLALHVTFGVLFVTIVIHMGGSLTAVAYAIRRKTVAGEAVFGPVIRNYLFFGLFAVPVLMVQLLRRRIGTATFTAAAAPWFPFLLIGTGRSGIVQLLLALLFVYVFIRRKLGVRFVVLMAVVLAVVLAGGAILTRKVDIQSGMSTSQRFTTLLRSTVDYAAEGPILFSRYAAGEISVEPNWSPYRGICNILELAHLCHQAPVNLSSYHQFRNGMVGNVYSLFFSLFPGLSYLGLVAYALLYGVATAVVYSLARRGSLLFTILAAYLFGATVLSLYSDGFGSGLETYLKLALFGALFWLVFQAPPRLRILRRTALAPWTARTKRTGHP